MQPAACQMRPRPDSAVSTPASSPAKAAVVSCTRLASLGEATAITASSTAAVANTPSSGFQPSSRQPENTSTSA